MSRSRRENTGGARRLTARRATCAETRENARLWACAKISTPPPPLSALRACRASERPFRAFCEAPVNTGASGLVLTQSRFAGQGECRVRNASRHRRVFLRSVYFFNAKFAKGLTQRSPRLTRQDVFGVFALFAFLPLAFFALKQRVTAEGATKPTGEREANLPVASDRPAAGRSVLKQNFSIRFVALLCAKAAGCVLVA